MNSLDSNSYRRTFEHAIEGIFRTTLDGRWIEVNPALARIYGYQSPDELVRMMGDLNTQLYVEPGRRTEFVRLMVEKGAVSDFESEVYRADGSTIWIAEFARTVFNETGNRSIMRVVSSILVPISALSSH